MDAKTTKALIDYNRCYGGVAALDSALAMQCVHNVLQPYFSAGKNSTEQH